jgi:hypothetical protein
MTNTPMTTRGRTMPPPLDPNVRATVSVLEAREGVFTYIGGKLHCYDANGKAVPVLEKGAN